MTENYSFLYHGSSRNLIGDKLLPSLGDDSEERPENNLLAVYATDRKDLAIVMAILSCKDVIGGSIEKYTENKLNATIYGNFPKQKYIYIYSLSVDTFKQTKIDRHQFVSFVSVKPLQIEKVVINDFIYLFDIASQKKTSEWIKKYGDSRIKNNKKRN